MATVVQVNCPGCHKTLRIPSDWVQRPICCKHCGAARKCDILEK